MAKHSYLGNPKLKKVGTKINFTQDMLNELYRCSYDYEYFCEKYVKIIHVDRGIVNFKPYPFQKEIISSFLEQRFTIVATARQCGKTTSVVAAILHYIIFAKEKGKLVALLANKAATSREILSRVQLAYENLPIWMQQGVKEWNKGSIELENECRVIAAATSSSSIRGLSVSMLVIDEAAFVENWEQFFTSTYPTISSGEKTKVCLITTPNGLNHFHKIFVDAGRDRESSDWNRYNRICVSWREVPGRDERWASDQRALLGPTKFSQEHEVAFLGSTLTLISPHKLMSLVHQNAIHETSNLSVYVDPIPGHQYCMTCDVSEGKGLDYSAFNVFDVTQLPYIQVARFRDNFVSTVEYGEYIYQSAMRYNNASVLIEVNNGGKSLVEYLMSSLEYDNVIATANKGPSGKDVSTGGNYEYGIRTTKSTKQVGCQILKELIEKDQLLICDHLTLGELTRFSRNKNSFEAEVGATDDIVMSLVMFAWLSSRQYFVHLTNTDIMAKLKQKSESELMNQLTPIGFWGQKSSSSSVLNEYRNRGYSLSDFDEEFSSWSR